jgi:hypothetical protein
MQRQTKRVAPECQRRFDILDHYSDMVDFQRGHKYSFFHRQEL